MSLPTAFSHSETSGARDGAAGVNDPAAELRSDAAFEANLVQLDGGVIVLFDADWCAPGRPLWANLQALARKGLPFPVRRLDIGLAPNVARRYGVAGLPSLVFFRNGQIAASRLGTLSEEALKSWIDELDEA
jgi:thioredoxin 1